MKSAELSLASEHMQNEDFAKGRIVEFTVTYPGRGTASLGGDVSCGDGGSDGHDSYTVYMRCGDGREFTCRKTVKQLEDQHKMLACLHPAIQSLELPKPNRVSITNMTRLACHQRRHRRRNTATSAITVADARLHQLPSPK